MDRILNSRIETHTIYEIYRACRLCGAGAGYKMPIIQNVVNLEGSEVELKQKILECVQIEVHQDDKMPPLICELCVDKVNDFYEFLELCQKTNKKTRMRLGLPMQKVRKEPKSGDNILGVKEPVYIDDSDDEKPLKNKNKDRENLSKHRIKVEEPHKIKSKDQKVVKKEPDVQIKVENQRHNQRNAINNSSRSSRSSKQNHSPRDSNRQSKSSDDMTRSSSLESKKSSSKTTPKSILKREKDIPVKTEESPHTPRLRSMKEERNDGASLLKPRPKRFRDIDLKEETPAKRIKLPVDSKPCAKASPKTSPKGAKPPLKGAPAPTGAFSCPICKINFKNPQGHASHMRGHLVTFTNIKLTCNACGEWFRNHDEAATHHRKHKTKNIPYTCRWCTADFQHPQAYDDHFAKKQCIPSEEVPDVKCESCWRLFPTTSLMADHKCPGEDGRPGGKCSKCRRGYALLKNLTKHEVSCTAKKKGNLIVDPEVLARLKPMQIRVARCDPLLTNIKQEHYDVSTVNNDYGLDRSCYYPYIASVSSIRIKTEPGIEEYDNMVAIKEEIKEEFCTEEHFVHWDSEESSEEELPNSLLINPFAKKKPLESLSTLSLKTIFSQKFLGKVPRKKRKVKAEKNAFDSILNTSEFDSIIRKDIDSIIDNLGKDDFNETDDLQKTNNSVSDSLIQSETIAKDISVVDASNSDNSCDLLLRGSSEGATDILQWSEMDEKMIDNFDSSSNHSKLSYEQNINYNENHYISDKIETCSNATTLLERDTDSSKTNLSKVLTSDNVNIDHDKDTQENTGIEPKSVFKNKINNDLQKIVLESTENKAIGSIEEVLLVNNSIKGTLENSLLPTDSIKERPTTVTNAIEKENVEDCLLKIKSQEEDPMLNDKIEETLNKNLLKMKSMEEGPTENNDVQEDILNESASEIRSHEEKPMENNMIEETAENSLLQIKSAEKGPPINSNENAYLENCLLDKSREEGLKGNYEIKQDNRILEIIPLQEEPTINNRIQDVCLENGLLEIKSAEEQAVTKSNGMSEGDFENDLLQEDMVVNKNAHKKDTESSINKTESLENQISEATTQEIKHFENMVENDVWQDNDIETKPVIDKIDEMDLERRLLDDNSTSNMSMEEELNNKIDEDAIESRLLNTNDGVSSDMLGDTDDTLPDDDDNETIPHKNDHSETTDAVTVKSNFQEVTISFTSQRTGFKDTPLEKTYNENDALYNYPKLNINDINDFKTNYSNTKPDVNQGSAAESSEIIQCINKNSDSKNFNESEFNKNIKCDTVTNGASRNSDTYHLDDVSDTEMDDRKLMEALDAQIAENSHPTVNIDCDKDKISLQDLLSKQDENLRSMDLDSISDDDFNFDI